ncbi:MAG: hypothetical protein ACOCXP_02680 [Candidatus Dojkabacteria bacterium]
MYLLQSVAPDEDVLVQQLGVSNTKEAVSKVIDHSSTVDMELMKNDVRPFLFRSEDVSRLDLFIDLLKQKFEL